jgi:hypothetical protein
MALGITRIFGILKNTKEHNVSGTESISFLRWGGWVTPRCSLNNLRPGPDAINCCWPSSAQSFLVPSPFGTHSQISIHFNTVYVFRNGTSSPMWRRVCLSSNHICCTVIQCECIDIHTMSGLGHLYLMIHTPVDDRRPWRHHPGHPKGMYRSFKCDSTKGI